MKNGLIILFSLLTLSSFGVAAPLATVQCEVSQNGVPGVSIEKLQVQADQCIDAACNPVKSITVGNRIVRMTSSGGKFYLTVVDKELEKTGPVAYMGQYSSFEGAPATGGFTGKIMLVLPNLTSQNYDHSRVVAFKCYKVSP